MKRTIHGSVALLILAASAFAVADPLSDEIDRLKPTFSRLGLQGAQADEVARHYIQQPDGRCAKLAARALRGDNSAKSELRGFPGYCARSDHSAKEKTKSEQTSKKQEQAKADQPLAKYAPPKMSRERSLVDELQGLVFKRDLAEVIVANIKKDPGGNCARIVQLAKAGSKTEVEALRDKTPVCGPYPEPPPPPDGKAARTHYANLTFKYLGRFIFSSDEVRQIVMNYKMDCKRPNGRYVPLMRILLSTVESVAENLKIKRVVVAENRGSNVRIFYLDEFVNGEKMETFAFSINEWGEIQAFNLPRFALAQTCTNDSDPGRELFVDPDTR